MVGRDSVLSSVARRRVGRNANRMGRAGASDLTGRFVSVLPVKPQHQGIRCGLRFFSISGRSCFWTADHTIRLPLHGIALDRSRALSLHRTRVIMAFAAAFLSVGEYTWFMAD